MAEASYMKRHITTWIGSRIVNLRVRNCQCLLVVVEPVVKTSSTNHHHTTLNLLVVLILDSRGKCCVPFKCLEVLHTDCWIFVK